MRLTGPSLKGDVAELLWKAADDLEEQATSLRAMRRELVKDCKHEFDDGTCSTENLGLADQCVICGG